MSDRIQAVLLDMGGVLIPEVPHYDKAAREPQLRENLARLGIRRDETDALIARIGRRAREAYRGHADARTQPDLDEVLSDVPTALRHVLLRAFAREAAQPPFSYARDVVADLARRYTLGLVSNTVFPGDHHARSLARAGILEHFGAAVWSANFGYRKPHPAMLLHVLARLGVSARSAVFVGDKLRTDVAAARRAGIRSIWLRGAGFAQGPDDPRPDFTILDLRELSSLLRELGPGSGTQRPVRLVPSAHTRSRK